MPSHDRPGGMPPAWPIEAQRASYPAWRLNDQPGYRLAQAESSTRLGITYLCLYK